MMLFLLYVNCLPHDYTRQVKLHFCKSRQVSTLADRRIYANLFFLN